MSELEPITLREKYLWQPLKIRLPLPAAETVGGTHIVIPALVDWFVLPEWTYFWNPIEGSRDPHFFDPNFVSVELERFR